MDDWFSPIDSGSYFIHVFELSWRRITLKFDKISFVNMPYIVNVMPRILWCYLRLLRVGILITIQNSEIHFCENHMDALEYILTFAGSFKSCDCMLPWTTRFEVTRPGILAMVSADGLSTSDERLMILFRRRDEMIDCLLYGTTGITRRFSGNVCFRSCVYQHIACQIQ